MRKFRLIKKYPGSPELNFIVTYGYLGLNVNELCYQGIDLEKILRFSKEHIEDNTEFWEEILDEDAYPEGTQVQDEITKIYFTKTSEGWLKYDIAKDKTYRAIHANEIGEGKRYKLIKKPDANSLKLTTKHYEVLALKIPGNEHWEITKIGNGTWDNWSDLHVQTQLKKGIWKVKRVKRLSDGEIFSIGDEVEYFSLGLKHQFIITGFILSKDGDRCLLSSERFQHHIDLFSIDSECINNYKLQKSKKQPVLITQDCVEVFEGDEYYTVCENSYNISINTATKDCVKKLNNKTKIFSTKEKADNYIIWNKPMLSLKEIAGIYPGINKNHANTPSHQAELLKKLAEEKYYNR